MTVKLGFIGCGFMGQVAHIKNCVMLDGVELVGVAGWKAKDCPGSDKALRDQRSLSGSSCSTGKG